jgi:hypothetical protein
MFLNFKKSPNRWRQKGSTLENVVSNVLILGDFRDMKKYFRDFARKEFLNPSIFNFILNVWYFSFY